jgi:hypothetical protein
VFEYAPTNLSQFHKTVSISNLVSVGDKVLIIYIALDGGHLLRVSFPHCY